jgi:xanthine dehydrogenase accessory factor
MSDRSAQFTPSAIMRVIPELLDGGTMAVIVTVIEHPQFVGAKLLLDERGRSLGTLGSVDVDRVVLEHAAKFLGTPEDIRTYRSAELSTPTEFGDSLFLFERIRPEAQLVICGAGHVGASLSVFASLAGYRVTLIDDRQEFLKAERFSNQEVRLLLADNWTDAVRQAVGNGKGVSLAVVTRGHNEDEQCMRAAITTNPDYIGLIGSKRRTSIVINRLREAGATEAQVKRIHAPIGLDIGAVTPEEVALAILAEIVCVRRGGSGGSLSAWRRQSS